MAKLTKLEQKTLEEAIVATKAGSFIYVSPDVYEPLVAAGLVEINLEIINEEGEVATRAILTSENKVEEPKIERKNLMFEIENVPVEAGKRGGNRKSKYGETIDALEVGQSFFIEATEKNPEPEKTLATMVSAAMKKYDVPDLDESGVQKTKVITVPKTGEKRTIPAMKHTRKFTLVKATKNGVNGARIGRTA